ncbi:translation intitation factor 1A [Fragilaria crotonensis]|nr:translation intitation factor 1A [Fragilaria crotonensis]
MEERIEEEEREMVKNPSVNWNSRRTVKNTPVVKMLGNGRCECYCYDGVTRLGHIRGKMRKKVWITAGDIVLCGKREFQDEKVDIIHKYSADEARNLKQYGELPDSARINETAVDMANTTAEEDDIGIDFDDI